MYNLLQNDNPNTASRKKSVSQSSNLAKYGKMGISTEMKPSNLTMTNIKYGQSIDDFHSQLSRMAKNQQFRIKKKYLERNKRAYTEIQQQSNNDDIYTEKLSGRTMTPIVINTRVKDDATKELHSELEEIKRMIEQQRKVNSMESRFQKLYQQIEKKNSQPQQFNPFGPYPPMMYPPNYMYGHPYPPPFYNDDYEKTSQRLRRRKPSQQDNLSNYTLMSNPKQSRNPSSRQRSTLNNYGTTKKNPSSLKPTMRLNRNWATHLLKKYFYAVTFMFFLKKQSKKISMIRKNNLRKFWLEKFQSQVTNMKNWLLESMKYSLSIILQKKQLNFDFFNEKRPKVKKQKQKLVLQLLYLFVQQMKKLSNPKDVSLFSEIIVIVCRNGSFPISRFWTINEMQKLRISEYYGFIRADQTTQKLMITLFVFIKVLIFNMLLQPYKFDSINFTKTSQPLLSNMFLLASILYHIVKEVLQQFINEPKQDEMYEPGNWLKVKKQFICECCQPLIYNSQRYQKGEYISGMLEREMFNEMLEDEDNFNKWQMIREKILSIVDSLYIEMKAKSKMLKSNIKFKLYN